MKTIVLRMTGPDATTDGQISAALAPLGIYLTAVPTDGLGRPVSTQAHHNKTSFIHPRFARQQPAHRATGGK